MNQFFAGKRLIINLFSDHSKNDDGAIGLNSRGYSGAVLPFEFHNTTFSISLNFVGYKLSAVSYQLGSIFAKS